MDSLFTYLTNLDSVLVALIVIAIALLIGVAFTYVVSRKLKSSKGFFITATLMPVIIASIISMMTIFLSDSTTSNISRIVTISVALGLIRFRSMNAKAEELLILFTTVAIGLVAGLGYVVISAIIALVVATLYFALSNTKLFNNKKYGEEKLLKVTIPENLEYDEAFQDTFQEYLKSNELVEIKTTGMGSMYRLSYKVELKDTSKQKGFIDELRVKNGNLEISLLPYVAEDKSL